MLEEETGERVYYQTGLVYFGRPEMPVVKGVKLSAELYKIPVEKVDERTSKQRFPHFTIPNAFETLYEQEAGFLTPEKAIKIYAAQAARSGAVIHTAEKVISWRKEGNSILLDTNKDSYRCGKLIITAGAWSGNLIPGMAEKIKVTRQFVAWIKPKNWNEYTLNNFPCWIIDEDERKGCYYGFPILPPDEFGAPHGLKIACHYLGTVTEADQVNRQTGDEDIDDIRYALDKYFPGTFNGMVTSKTCLYANLPDENFIIDKLPGYENEVSIGCGFSGHGFKFASVFGEILADLSMEGSTKYSIGFLNAKRFAWKGSA